MLLNRTGASKIDAQTEAEDSRVCSLGQEKTKSKVSYDDLTDAKKKKGDTDPTYSENMKLSIKIMERMVNQNLS